MNPKNSSPDLPSLSRPRSCVTIEFCVFVAGMQPFVAT